MPMPDTPAGDEAVHAALRSHFESVRRPREDDNACVQWPIHQQRPGPGDAPTLVSDPASGIGQSADRSALTAARTAIARHANGVLQQLYALESDVYAQYKTKPTQWLDERILTGRQNNARLRSVALFGTQMLGTRPLTDVVSTPTHVVVSDYGGTVTLLDADLEPVCSEVLHLSQARGISVDTARSKIYSGGGNGEIVVADFELTRQSILYGHANRITGTQPIPDAMLVSSDAGGVCKLWDLNKEVCMLTQIHGASVRAMAVHECGALVLAALSNGSVALSDLRVASPVQQVASHAASVTCCSWRSGTLTFASGGDDNVCLVTDIRKVQQPLATIYAHPASVTSTLFTPLGLVTAGADCQLRFWSLDTYRLQHSERTLAKVTALTRTGLAIFSARYDRCVDKFCLDL